MANELIEHESQSWITAKMVADLAEQGDVAAQKIFNEAGRYLGRSLSIIANLFNPDTIIIGGGIASARKLLLRPVLEEYEAKTMDVIRKHTTIEISSLGIEAGVLGAIALALDTFVFKQDVINCM